MWNYARPYFTFGVLSTALTASLTLLIQPISYSKYTDLQLDMVRYRAEEKILPGEFNYDFGDKVIHVAARNPDKTLSSVFIADRVIAPKSAVIAADRGRIEVDEGAKKVLFKLQNGQIVFQEPDPAEFRTLDFATLNYVLDFLPGEQFEGNWLWSMPTATLLDELAAPKGDPKRTSRIELELYFRITTPLACLAFSIAALPLGVFNPRSGQSGSFIKAILLVVVYYILWIGFKDLAHNRVAPPPVLLVPPLLIALYGLYRIWLTDHDALSGWQFLRRWTSPA
jgi:lipopolysaccharide export system permease protein